MNENIARQLAKITDTLLAASTSLLAHAGDLVKAIIEALPDVEPTSLTVSVAEDTTDTTRMTAQLAWDNTGNGDVKLDWGVTDVTDDQEPEVGTATYQYTTAGTYTATVIDYDDETRTASVEVIVPFTS